MIMMIFKQVLNTAQVASAGEEEHFDEFFLDYYLVKKMHNHRRQKICYGIGVEKYLINGSGKQSLEFEEVEDMSHDSDDVVNILKTLYENTVTPMSVLEVLDDIMV